MPSRHNTRQRFEQWVRNPDCEANVISAVAGISMADVARNVGLEPTMGQSPFAIARGVTFERALLADGARRLREALEKAGVLPVGSSGFLDLRLRLNRGPIADLETAHEKTLELLVAAADPACWADLPSIVTGATLKVPGQPVMLPEGVVSLDVLTSVPQPSGERIHLRVGEVKTYPDRGGYTDRGQLAGARAQAGVYLHALRLFIDDLGIADRVHAESEGFLVLTRPGGNIPSVRADEQLELQARRAARGFERLREAVAGLTPFDPDDSEDAVRRVTMAATSYVPACLSHCDVAPRCRKDAEERGDGVVLGDDVARFLGPIPLRRASELFDGAPPQCDSERDLVRRYHEVGGGA
jgi:hypothetical protein